MGSRGRSMGVKNELGASIVGMASLTIAAAGGWDDRFTIRGLDNLAVALEVAGGSAYVAGQFTTAGGSVVNGVARWDGTTWIPLGPRSEERRVGQEWGSRWRRDQG